MDHRLHVGLDGGHLVQDFSDFYICRGLISEKNIAVGVGDVVALLNKLGELPDMTVITANQLQEAKDTTLVDRLVGKWRGCRQ